MSAVDFIEQNLHPDGSQAFIIRNETAQDERAREALLDRAMGEGRRRKSSEKLRRGRLPSEGLAFVARGINGALLGTVRLWDIQAGHDAAGKPVRALLLGPLAVEPSLKGQGHRRGTDAACDSRGCTPWPRRRSSWWVIRNITSVSASAVRRQQTLPCLVRSNAGVFWRWN